MAVMQIKLPNQWPLKFLFYNAKCVYYTGFIKPLVISRTPRTYLKIWLCSIVCFANTVRHNMTRCIIQRKNVGFHSKVNETQTNPCEVSSMDLLLHYKAFFRDPHKYQSTHPEVQRFTCRILSKINICLKALFLIYRHSIWTPL